MLPSVPHWQNLGLFLIELLEDLHCAMPWMPWRLGSAGGGVGGWRGALVTPQVAW
jgi:hypothetical protein